MKHLWDDPEIAGLGFLFLVVAVLLTWAIMGISKGTTYSRDFEAACAAAGGKMQSLGIGGDACWKVTYEVIPLRDVRHP